MRVANPQPLGDWMDAITGALSNINISSLVSSATNIYGDIAKVQAAKAQANATVQAAAATNAAQLQLLQMATGGTVGGTTVPVQTANGVQYQQVGGIPVNYLLYGGGALALLLIVMIARR